MKKGKSMAYLFRSSKRKKDFSSAKENKRRKTREGKQEKENKRRKNQESNQPS